MPSYKLIYFPLRARGEPIRQLFALAGVNYEEVNYTFDEWPQHKGDFPFGQLPVLEVDGKPLAQSMTICRYLANQFGFAGSNDFEAAQIDMISDQFADYFDETSKCFQTLVGFLPGDKDFMVNSVLIPARDKWFRILSHFLKDNEHGFLIGDTLSYVDLLLAIHVDGMEGMVPGFANDFPRTHSPFEWRAPQNFKFNFNKEILEDMGHGFIFRMILAHRDKVNSIPEIADYLAQRPDYPF